MSKEEIGAIEEAGSKLHQTNFMSHIFKDQGRQGLKLERACHQTRQQMVSVSMQ